MITHFWRNLVVGFAVTAMALTVPIVAMAATVQVTPSNMNGWVFGSDDPNGTPVNSGNYAGHAEMVSGPATPPLGTGSAHLATNTNYGGGAEYITTNNFDGTLLKDITSLSYSTYMVTNNGSQQPYLLMAISTDGNPVSSGSSNLDFMFFEPPYQTPTSGNPSLPNQGTVQMDTWQTWSAAEGGWWDGNGIGTSGAVGPTHTGVQPISTFLAAYPDATIVDPGLYGMGGVSLVVGWASDGETFDGNVDAFTFGSTTYNFDPSAVPEPATALLIGLGLFGFCGIEDEVREGLDHVCRGVWIISGQGPATAPPSYTDLKAKRCATASRTYRTKTAQEPDSNHPTALAGQGLALSLDPPHQNGWMNGAQRRIQ